MRESVREGEVREAQEEKANQSADRVAAPACPGCGASVADKDYERHRYEVHNARQVVQPWGKPDAREALFTGPTPEQLEAKIAQWRTTHPGVQLRFLGSGVDRDRKGMLWARFRVRPLLVRRYGSLTTKEISQ